MRRLRDVPSRTTLTLDDDVAAGLEREVRRTGRSFRAVVNEALRVGLEHGQRVAPAPYVVEPADLGLRTGLELDHVSGVLEALEGARHR
jgi:hypothetical protein